ncbi:beta-xylanase [Insulibacter thermoxylanivorax]|uniref:Beta-xylanase n=1 Tax=Insulibacter thermoxylanivorax TaxID=2749268 RepID=A0A916QDI5_9BACL|nr:endo-1,4-beta-xylanase [Insulibacter thermoxylanivorax]GFR38732.1 beta-xylanase [Insulibacter thermoxylanivorax]
MTSNSQSIPKLREVFKNHFLIGAAVNPITLKREEELIKFHFNSLTAENEMKFERLQPEEGKFTFQHADELMDFAAANGLKVRGHTLVWHNQTPRWVFEDGRGGQADRDTLFARMKAHIDTVVGRYKGLIYAWDVVNEAISDKGEELLRPSPWLEIGGEEFIARAFQYAHEADPDALLFYNDYNESDPVKREKIYTLVKSLLDRDVPIHGVGLQAHWNIESPSLDDIRAAIERYASLGLKLHITELDMSVFMHDDKRTDLKAPTEQMLEKQAERYRQIFDLFKEYKGHITSVTFWGVADNYTWLDNFPVRGRKNWPLVFDLEGKPKQSFWEIVG